MSSDLSALGAPPRFLTDMNFNQRIVAGFRRRAPDADIITVQVAGLQTVPDSQLLEEAMARDRILLTHDVNTMPNCFYELLSRLPQGEHSPGVMIVTQEAPIGEAIQAIYEVWSCSSHEEWRDLVTYLPL